MMTLITVCFAWIIIPICRVGGSYNHDDYTTPHYDLRRFDDIITTYMRERKIPGASIAVSRDGPFIVRKGYGRASSQRLMTPWALLRIGSISKVVTALGIQRLYDERRITLNSTVFGEKGLLSQFVTSRSDPRVEMITVLDLLQHSTGWDNRVTGDPLFQRFLYGNHLPSMTIVNKTDVVNFMLNKPLQYNPGIRYTYSNVGYAILGLIIERVTNKSYEEYMRDVLRRQGIQRMKLGKTLQRDADISETEYFPRYASDRAQSVFNDGQLVSPPYGAFNMELIDSSLGWISSASDLVRLFECIVDGRKVTRYTERQVIGHRALGFTEKQVIGHRAPGFTQALVSSERVKEMLAKPRYTNASVWYGLGVVVEDGGQSYWHSGTLDGSTSIVAHDLHGFTWAALVNSKLEPNDLGDFIRHAVHAAFKANIRATAYDAKMENDVTSTDIEPLAVSFHNPEVVRHVDSVSADGRVLIRLVIPDYKFSEVVALVSSTQYKLVWIDAFEEFGYIFFNVIWAQNDGTKWVAYHDLISSRYRKRFKSHVAHGYRLAHVESYVSRRRLRYAAIFIKDVWPEWKTYDGYSPHRHKLEFYRLMKDGYRLVVQSVVEYRGQLYVTAVYDRIYLGDTRVRLGLSLEDFAEELEHHLLSGRILSYVAAYEMRGLVKFSAIWAPKTTRYWAVSRTMTKYTLYNKIEEYAVVNIPLACVTAYHVNDVLHFAALWR